MAVIMPITQKWGRAPSCGENAMKFHCGNKTFTSILNKAAEAVG